MSSFTSQHIALYHTVISYISTVNGKHKLIEDFELCFVDTDLFIRIDETEFNRIKSKLRLTLYERREISNETSVTVYS